MMTSWLILFSSKLATTTNKICLLSTSYPNKVILSFNIRNRPYVILDINKYDISIKEYEFAKIQNHLQYCLHKYEEIKIVVIKDMNKDIKKGHHYFIFLHKKQDEKVAFIHVGKWLLSVFLKTFIQ